MKALVFDLDGTLVDTKYDMLEAGNLEFGRGRYSSPLPLRLLRCLETPRATEPLAPH